MSTHPAAIAPHAERAHPAPALSRAQQVRATLRDELARASPFWRAERVLYEVESNPRRVRTDAAHAHNADYQLGLLLAPAYIAFSRHVLEHAGDFDRVYFLSREGWMFMRMYHRLARALGVQGEVPRGRYLAANRRLTFLASMDRLSHEEIGRIWRQYPAQSLRRLLRNLSLPEGVFFPLAAAHGLTDPDRPIYRPRQNEAFTAFLSDGRVQREFAARRDEMRALLADYLRQRGFFDARRVALVDVGWKGSIQTNLHRAVRALPGCPEIHGIYLGLQHLPAMDATGSSRHGFFCDTRARDWLQECILRNNSVFEMFATAPHGSIRCYERDARARVHARTEHEPEERRNFRGRFREVWRAIDDWFADYLDTPAALAAPAAEIRPAILDRLRRFILYPTRAEARAFLHYSHVENFGVFQVSRYGFRGSPRRVLFGGPPWQLPHRLVRAVRAQRWREGVCKRSGVPFATFALDVLETRRNTR